MWQTQRGCQVVETLTDLAAMPILSGTEVLHSVWQRHEAHGRPAFDWLMPRAAAVDARPWITFPAPIGRRNLPRVGKARASAGRGQGFEVERIRIVRPIIFGSSGVLFAGSTERKSDSFVSGPDRSTRMALDTERQKIQHLLRRAGWGYSASELKEYLALGLQGSIDRLLAPESVDDSATEARVAGLAADPYQDRATLLTAWHLRIVSTRRPLLERMTYFWHDHFANSIDTVESPAFMQVQNDLFRARAFGRFDEMLTAVSRDPAMMVFLDNRLNVRTAPNENYARELMELHTLGEGNVYTEKDIQEAARALTGWRITLESLTKEQLDARR
ncbi:MAG: DUF1800 domain-containing protein, partial [Chloroflexi bacterium]|nr:DUF1800 domain-containing protein [Chloroflexota bacterium]